MKIKLEANFWTTVLFFIFLVLKLNGTIAWSWWWVTAPVWAPIVLAIIILMVVGIYENKSGSR